MVIRRKSSLDKIYYELMGQQSFFGRDNIFFKTAKQFIRNVFKQKRLELMGGVGGWYLSR